MVKKIISIFLIICLSVIPTLTVSAYEPTGFDITAKTAMLVSLDTDEVLYSKNENERVYPASITKIMTTILMLESEKYNPDAKIAMTDEVLDLISGTGSSVSLMTAGEEITQLDLVYMVLMASFGDSAYLAAIHFGGSVEGFVDMMNAKAKELGLTGTHYQNPVGLHDEDNYTTARDTYILTKYALENKTFKEACTTTRYTVQSLNKTLSTTNFMQDTTTNYYYTYAKGVKTGYTDEAGRCLVSTASYNGYNYMCVLFGCPPNAGQRHEFIDSKNLYRWAFNNFEFKQVADTANPICEIEVELSLQTDFISLYVEDGFISVLPTDADDSTISIVPHPTSESVKAPIKKGDVLGTADIIYAEQLIGKVNLVSNEDIEKSLMLTVWDAVKRFFTSSYMKAVYIIIIVLIAAFLLAVIKMNSGRRRRKVKYVPYSKHEQENKRRR